MRARRLMTTSAVSASSVHCRRIAIDSFVIELASSLTAIST
jgi:hypothetical protein